MLANKVYDHRSKRELGYGRELFTQNPTTVPIFIMNQLNGQHSGTMMWPGGEFAYTEQQIRSTFAVPLKKTPWNERVDTVVSWFKHDVTPTNLVTMYVNEPDDHGHSHGPDSDEVRPFCSCESAFLFIFLYANMIFLFTLHIGKRYHSTSR